MRILLTCALVATACRPQRAEPAPVPLDQQRPLLLRYCVVRVDDASPPMTLDDAIRRIEEHVADDRVEVVVVDDEIVVELPRSDASDAEARDLAEVMREVGPALEPCPTPTARPGRPGRSARDTATR